MPNTAKPKSRRATLAELTIWKKAEIAAKRLRIQQENGNTSHVRSMLNGLGSLAPLVVLEMTVIMTIEERAALAASLVFELETIMGPKPAPKRLLDTIVMMQLGEDAA